jgi:signal peptidase I
MVVGAFLSLYRTWEGAVVLAALVGFAHLLGAVVTWFVLRRSRRLAGPRASESLLKNVATGLLLCVAHVGLVVPALVALAPVRPYLIAEDSMLPTLRDGEILLVDTSAYNRDAVARGDIVVFDHPKVPEHSMVKRVIGLPSEQVRVLNAGVEVDGRTIEEPYLGPNGHRASLWTAYDRVTLDQGAVYVLGDNRRDSEDSRNFGPIPIADLHGGGLYLVWGPSTGRLGKIE